MQGKRFLIAIRLARRASFRNHLALRGEGDPMQMTTQLGQGNALDIFNQNILRFKRVK